MSLPPPRIRPTFPYRMNPFGSSARPGSVVFWMLLGGMLVLLLCVGLVFFAVARLEDREAGNEQRRPGAPVTGEPAGPREPSS